MTSNDLKMHPFSQEILTDAMNVQKDLGFKPLGVEVEPPLLAERQFYIARVGYRLAHALTWIEQLEHAVLYLSDYSYSKELKNHGVNRYHHLVYNIENYIVRLQSVYDRMLQLTNAVFHLCISDELVVHSIVVSNLKVERTKVPSLLKAVRKTMKDKFDDRNNIVHRQSLVEDKLSRVEMYFMFDKQSWEKHNSEIPYRNLIHMRSQRIKEIVREKRAEFRKINKSLITSIAPLFSALHTEYLLQVDRISLPAVSRKG